MKNRMFIVFSLVLALGVLAMPASAATPVKGKVVPAKVTAPGKPKSASHPGKLVFQTPKTAFHVHLPHTNPQGKVVGNGDPTWYEWTDWYVTGDWNGQGGQAYGDAYTQTSSDWPEPVHQAGTLTVVNLDPSDGSVWQSCDSCSMDMDSGVVNYAEGDYVMFMWTVHAWLDYGSWGDPGSGQCSTSGVDMWCHYMQIMQPAPKQAPPPGQANIAPTGSQGGLLEASVTGIAALAGSAGGIGSVDGNVVVADPQAAGMSSMIVTSLGMHIEGDGAATLPFMLDIPVNRGCNGCIIVFTATITDSVTGYKWDASATWVQTIIG